MLRAIFVLVILLTSLAAAAPAPAQLAATLVASGLNRPIFLDAPLGDPRLFVLERDGRIVLIVSGAVRTTPFLDITDRVGTTGEGGLLGLAFDPDYATNGLFYVYYTDLAGDSVLSRFAVSADPNVADPFEQVLLVVDQPYSNHNGGTIAFGPDDFLYVGLGDGGSSNDPLGAGQDPLQLLGKMLRLDVGTPPAPGSTPVPGTGYAVPADNPFANDPGTRDEIWALGLRNPYRWSFNPVTRNLWIADVGQGQREEVNFEPWTSSGGRNYGWKVWEGNRCNTTSAACAAAGFTPPLLDYDHSAGNCSITGGYSYRGRLIPQAFAQYFFGDFCSGRIWTYDTRTDTVSDVSGQLGPAANAGFQLVSFGEDGQGEMYVVHQGGDVYRVVSSVPIVPVICGGGFAQAAWLPPVVFVVGRCRRRRSERA
jgi:glucose/arabinose dehydrogenase